MWRNTRLVRAAVALIAVLALTVGAGAQTNVGGPIFGDTTWDVAGSPYILINSIVVGANATLTIDPGVEVLVNPGLGFAIGSTTFGPGTIVARGTLALPILFTSNVGFPFVPMPGDWNDIYFDPEAVDAAYDGGGNYLSGSILEYCIVEYAGGSSDWNTGSISIRTSSPALMNVEVRLSARSGIRAREMTTAPPLWIIDCELHDCVTGQPGGGLFIDGGNDHVISGLNTHDNSTYNYYGGGAYIQYATAVSVTGSTFQDNYAYLGGGFYGQSLTNLVMDLCTFQGNTAADDYGGLYIFGNAGTLTNLDILNNDSNYNAGGIGLAGNGMELTDCEVTNNTSNYGGGVYLSGSGHLLEGNVITNNFAVFDGGGSYINSTNTTFVQCDVRCNDAGAKGGGFFWNATGGSLAGDEIADTYNIIAFNTAPQGQSVYHDISFGNDLLAEWVCWGTTDSGEITAGIYDYFDNSTKGFVIFNPPADYPNCACPADSDCSGTVNVTDLLALLASWGLCTAPCPSDIDGSGTVNVTDLLALLAAWGACP